MSDFQDWCSTVRDWINRDIEDYPDTVVASWFRLVENDLSLRLRCQHQISLRTGTATDGRLSLPCDWQELDFVRVADGAPLMYKPRDDFFSIDASSATKYYSITGDYLLFRGYGDTEVQVEISYYADVPKLTARNTWLQEKFSSLFLKASIVAASSFGVEDERATGFAADVSNQIQTINDNHLKSKASGSRLKRVPRRGYG